MAFIFGLFRDLRRFFIGRGPTGTPRPARPSVWTRAPRPSHGGSPERRWPAADGPGPAARCAGNLAGRAVRCLRFVGAREPGAESAPRAGPRATGRSWRGREGAAEAGPRAGAATSDRGWRGSTRPGDKAAARSAWCGTGWGVVGGWCSREAVFLSVQIRRLELRDHLPRLHQQLQFVYLRLQLHHLPARPVLFQVGFLGGRPGGCCSEARGRAGRARVSHS